MLTNIWKTSGKVLRTRHLAAVKTFHVPTSQVLSTVLVSMSQKDLEKRTMVKEMEALKSPGLQFEENDEGGGYK